MQDYELLADKYDIYKMYSLIYGLPEQIEEAFDISYKFLNGISMKNIKHVVIAGMGGSAIGGELAKSILEFELKVPVLVNRGYKLPGFVNNESLVIASSYSGNTEETLSCYEDAKNRQASMIAITTGGKLKEKALKDKVPVLIIPSGLPPRAAIGYSFVPIYLILAKINSFLDVVERIQSLQKFLKKLREDFAKEVPGGQNKAKMLAGRIYGKIPLIYGSQGITEAVAMRWKGQLNENSKHPAFYNVFPELNHNEIMGYEAEGNLLKNFVAVILRMPEEHERIDKRIKITRDLIQDKITCIEEIWPRGENTLERIFYHIMLGDFVSYYLALLNEKDPSEINFINTLKQRMG
ncbi:bifunctional phosphoglucose/phosphomannose isomerase [Thermovenabulum gondwanense]|uniref:SIS domain-containing protein n=1 Tax=Thermovenabulum gondwanense TaxID=520767 RepID=A0A162MVB8_9FIRM|nr:bifunctional phosphoglucose/phosphomannose isomerase [Thermovenabulum gondwanense]KYO67811.1 hypothetical protein ATZ99_04510 [Thermovenabulum gondwanense]